MFNELKPCNCQSCHCVSTQWVCGFCGDVNPSHIIVCPCRYESQDWWYTTTGAPTKIRLVDVTFINSAFHE